MHFGNKATNYYKAGSHRSQMNSHTPPEPGGRLERPWCKSRDSLSAPLKWWRRVTLSDTSRVGRKGGLSKAAAHPWSTVGEGG